MVVSDALRWVNDLKHIIIQKDGSSGLSNSRRLIYSNDLEYIKSETLEFSILI